MQVECASALQEFKRLEADLEDAQRAVQGHFLTFETAQEVLTKCSDTAAQLGAQLDTQLQRAGLSAAGNELERLLAEKIENFAPEVTQLFESGTPRAETLAFYRKRLAMHI